MSPRTISLGQVAALQAQAERFRKVRALRDGHKRAAQFCVDSLLFEKQREILAKIRTGRFHGMCCPRRAGKTNLVVALLFDFALRTGLDVVYVGLTRKSAKKTVWEPPKGLGIVKLAQQLGAKVDRQELSVTFPNGAHVYVEGILDDRVKERFRGQSYALVVLDECQSISPELIGPFVEAVLEPTIADNGGTLILSGTPAEFCSGLFWEVVGAKEVEKYQAHWWSWEDNPFTRDQVRVEAESRRAQYGDGDTVYLREYCGLWVPDATSLCLPNFSEANEYTPDQLPPREMLWYSCIGIDVGSGGDNDPAAVVTWSVFKGDPHVWLTCEKKLVDGKGKLTDSDILAEVARQSQEWGPVAAASIDNVIAIAPAPGRDFPIDPAEKKEKAQQIRRMDDDCKRDGGIIKVPKGGLAATEFRTVFWDKKKLEKQGKKVPTNAVPNDIFDGAQYGYLRIVNLQSLPPPPKTAQEKAIEWARQGMTPPKPGSDWKSKMTSNFRQ